MTAELNESLVGQWLSCRMDHPPALTKGQKYQVLAVAPEKGQLRVTGDNTRHRWYSRLYFELSGAEVPLLERITLDDPIHDPLCDAIEVTLHFSDGSRRWCLCATPQYFVVLLQSEALPLRPGHTDGIPWYPHYLFGQFLQSSQDQPVVAFNLPHLIMVSVLSEQNLWTVLQHLDRQDELCGSSRACS